MIPDLNISRPAELKSSEAKDSFGEGALERIASGLSSVILLPRALADSRALLALASTANEMYGPGAT